MTDKIINPYKNLLCEVETQKKASHRGEASLSLLDLLLSETHAGLNDVDYIVGEFLTLVDNVHIDRTDGVSVLVVVDIGDVLRLQLVAVVVDLVLDIE